MQNPSVGRVSSEFGTPRPAGPHAGIDLKGPEGQPVFAAFAGQVIKTATAQVPGSTTSGRAPQRTGNGARVRNPDAEQQVYNHTMPVVFEGDAVKEGQFIGYLDTSGQQTGTHLHFETWDAGGRPRNPRAAFTKFGVAPGSGAPSAARGQFLPLRSDGNFGHRTITELQRALARTGRYRGAIEADGGAHAFPGPKLFTAYQQFLQAKGQPVGAIDGGFRAVSVKAEQGWLRASGFLAGGTPGTRDRATIKALQAALNARALG
ncbi:M23 family metallopeptidase [Occultella glacieicola]|uniref:M23 family metallopeptidase n=1 Tax=Occultella glacieicola TaxID=2518684 RepID=A0ABY2E0X4_9MICO|nr:M23 family metallopeptidase [Occultella glacieicola]TDE90418.1 M23 family metallopeptidase [Occultella glacieicola]